MPAKLDERILEYLQKTIVYTDATEKQHFLNLVEWATGNNTFAEELFIKFWVTDTPMTDDDKKHFGKGRMHVSLEDDVAHTSIFLSYTFTAVWSLEENFNAFAQFVHQEMRKILGPRPTIHGRQPKTENGEG